jgi:hypothetical protein
MLEKGEALSMPKEGQDISEVPGYAWRVSLSIVVAFGWLILLVIWLFFFAGGFNMYQNLAVLMISIAVMAVVEGLIWKPLWWELGKAQRRRGVAFAIVAGSAIVVFSFIWLFFYAGSYTSYQNLAVFALALGVWSLAQPLGWRPAADKKTETPRITAFSAVVTFAWSIFLFVWFFYYADAYTLLDNIIVFFVSATAMGVVQGVARTPWRLETEQPGYRWRVVLSLIMGVAWFIFFLLWLYVFAGGYTVYQNIAIILVSVLIVAAVLAAAWAPWGIKYAHKKKKGAS